MSSIPYNAEGESRLHSSDSLQEQIASRGPWFHNMQIGGVWTAPSHALGDFPTVKWRHIEAALPADMTGSSVLDIGCNAGFYSQEMYRRGASRVLAIDTNDRYLEQARFAAKVNGCAIEFRKLSVYELDQVAETFHYVFFLGVFYHLRYPLFALDRVIEKVDGRLFFQSLLRPRPSDLRSYPPAKEYAFDEQTVFKTDASFPRMQFIEGSFAGDPTNWWLPNAACVEAVLRSSGMRIVARPEDETWVCEPVRQSPRGRTLQQQELSGLRA